MNSIEVITFTKTVETISPMELEDSPYSSPFGSNNNSDQDEEVNDPLLPYFQKMFDSAYEKVQKKEMLSFKEAAVFILGSSNKLMTAEEIVKQAIQSGIIQSQGKTPDATMSSRLNTDISSNGMYSIFVKFGAGRFSIRPKFVQHITTTVLTEFEQQNGMKLLKGSALKFIPFEKEEFWLEVKPSQIPNSGMGLYAKFPITAGTVLSEYKGRILELDTGGDVELYPYGVSVQMPDGTVKMIDGMDGFGNITSFAPRANDAGPFFQNALLAEYRELPGRVFLEATRDIKQGEEIFVLYGPTYWGFHEYPPINDINYVDFSFKKSIIDRSSSSRYFYTCRPSKDNLLKLIFTRYALPPIS